jgi:hypothetical protein
MAPRKSEGRDRLAWELAHAQHEVVTRRQLLGLGFSPDAIRHRLASGRLWPLARGVYSVGPPRGTREQRWTAAVLICGTDAALSHRSAAALGGIGVELTGRIDVSVRGGFESRRAGLRVRSRAALGAEEIGERDGIPVTSIVQTLVDLATELPDGPLERCVNEADKHDLIDPGRGDQSPGQRGRGRLLLAVPRPGRGERRAAILRRTASRLASYAAAP